MEEGQLTESNQSAKMTKKMKKFLLIANCVMLGIGNCFAPLSNRLYFVKGGNRVWLGCALETAGFPFLIFPILASYIYRRKTEGRRAKLISITPHLLIPCAVIGILTGADDYMDTYGVSRLPVSTYSLVLATQLGFTAFFAWILVKQKFTFLHINSIFLLTAGAVVLAINSGSDVPEKESKLEYIIGFLMTLGAASLYGFVLPLIELMYKKAKQRITYALVMEMQFVMAFFATAFCVVGMLINHDFRAIPREAETYELGKGLYYLTVVGDAFLWQLFFLGAVGVIFCDSSLLSGVLISFLLPLSEILAVWFFHEKFTVEKGISLALALWGFISYFYGDCADYRKKKRAAKDDVESQETVAVLVSQ